ncbi:MAG: head maturation protease, ClpP-related [Cyanobacteria bacterium P01_A01_bin.17]
MKNQTRQAISAFDLPQSALDRWNPSIRASEGGETTLNILGVIGEDYYADDGTPASKVSDFLAQAGGEDVVININSPGGDFFDGLAIHSMLKDYEGKVHVKILGLAASAASVIALAGDEIEIAKSGFYMIHNSWSLGIGNKHDMRAVADMLDKFDASMKELYMETTGLEADEVVKMMDEETWLSSEGAIDMGFNFSVMGEEQIKEIDDEPNALRETDMLLAKAGVTRNKRRKLLNSIKGTQDAANPKQDAGPTDSDVLLSLLNSLKTK